MTGPTVGPEVRLTTLAGLLRARAAERPDQVAFTFLAEGEREAGRLTYAGLDRAAAAIAAALRETLPAGERVLLLYPPGLDFIAAFFGCLYAGAVAVPAYPPRANDRSQSRLRAIARDAEPLAALTTTDVLTGVESPRGLLAVAPELAAVRWISTDALSLSAASTASLPEPDPDAVAFLQYTSGSTADPKGVMVTQANLLHNERLIGDAFGMDESSVVVGWLPLYHDMGLIGNVLQPLYAGARCVLMSPVSFLQRPLRWLEAISRWRATTSGGPNFAYELCLRKASPEALAGLDLASWRVAFNGAEPVRAATLERFAETFAPYGFRPEAFYPCYGLAEATLFVTGGGRGRLPRIAALDAAALERNEALPAGGGEEARRLVSCGHAWGEQRVVVADLAAGTECPPGAIGEIWVSGPSVARGYWRNPEATARDFNAFLLAGGRGEGPFLRTGDLGFLADGQLYVTGRLKDLVILRGRNHYPQDLELTAEAGHPDLRPGSGAAFPVEMGGEERLVIVHEVERRWGSDVEEIAEAVRRAIAAEHEVQVHEVVLIRQGGLPKTSSGKVQRRLCRKLYLAGELPVVGRSALAWAEAAPEMALALTRAGLAALEPPARRERLAAYLRERAAAALGVAGPAISPRQPLTGLGLDSLTAVELKGSVEAALGITLPLADLLQGAAIEDLADLLDSSLEGMPAADLAPLRALSPAGDEPLSAGQRGLWFLHRLDPQAGAYNIVVAARTRDLDPAAFARALAALVDRHDSLRTVFPLAGDEPVRRILVSLPPDVRVEDGTSRDERPLRRRLAEEAWRPFDLGEGPLLRSRVFALAGGEAVVLLAVHHIVADFASLAVIARELSALYRQERGGPGAALAPPGLRYGDYVRWQEELLAGPRGERLWSYWRQRLDGVRDLDLPADRPRPPVQTYRGAARTISLSSSLLEGLRTAGSATLFTSLHAVFQAQLARYSGQEDFAVGSPAAGRPLPELAGLVGYFVNVIALRTDLRGEPRFADLLARTQRAVLAGLEHGDLPFPLLAERLRPARDPARSPVFQALFVLQQGRPQDPPGLAPFALGQEGARIELGGLELESVRLEERRSQLDLALHVAEDGRGGLHISLELNSDLFDGATAERMLGHFRSLLAAAAAAPDASIWSLPLLAPAERRQVLEEWNATARADPRGLLLHQLFEMQAARTPDAAAVVAGGVRLTYGELNRRANQLAHHLRRQGVGAEDRVGICLRRSERLVVSLLGVLKAGGAYVPLDPAYPRQRLELILEDSQARWILGEEETAAGLGAGSRGRWLRLDAAAERIAGERTADPEPVADAANLAYLIYTSGSTGRPKAVAVEHRSPVVLIQWARETFPPEDFAGVLASTSIGFDLSVFEIFVPLSCGGRVILAENVLELARLPAAGEVTLVNTVPSAMAEVLRGGWLPPSVRTVNLAGEPIPPVLVEAVRALVPAPRLYNLYGPSEDTTYSTFAPLADGAEAPIGRPLAGTRAYVLDARGEPLPAGVPGELHLAGEGLARCYLGRPELTAEKLVPDPFAVEPGARLYRTGDLARWRRDGVLDFLGRADHQVKVRGFRIELGEIEAALGRHPRVREAVVVAREDGEAGKRLVAYVAPADVAAAELRAFLREILPAPMVPSVFVGLDALPLSPHGKLDRRALPDPGRAAAGAVPAMDRRAPVEELVAGVAAELLGVDSVGPHDDFFIIGGHSLLAVRLLARVSRLFGVDLPLATVFTHPTAAGLAERIEAASGVGVPAAPPVRPLPRRLGEALPASHAQRQLWFLDRLEPGSAVYHLPGAVRLSGLLDTSALDRALAEIVRRHEALRTVLRAVDGEPVQVVQPPPAAVLPLIDLSAVPEPLRGAEVERLARQAAIAPFDLRRGPLFRVLAVRRDAADHELLLTLHHVVADGWSLEVLLSELNVLYGAFAAGLPSPLPELPIQYADWAVWQRERLQGTLLETQLGWWRRQLAGAPTLDLPADRKRQAGPSSRGGTRQAALPAGTAEKIGRLARREGATAFMVLLAALQAQLARYTAADLVPVGSPVANRGRAEEGLIGFFVNMLVFQTPVGGDPAFQELLARAREVCLGAYAHPDVPFDRLVEELRPERLRARNPLFQAAFQLDEPLSVRRLGEVAAAVRRLETGTAKFDLLLSVVREPRSFAAVLEYDADLYDPSTADRLLGHWRTLVEGIADDPRARLSELPLLTAPELAQIRSWSGRTTAYPRQATIHGLFAEQVRRTPQAVALEIGDERVSYAELEARADRLAARLRRRGIGLETPVGLCTERSAAFVVGLLGILKAGGAFVPLDPSYPAERLAFMAEDSGCDLLVVQEGLASLPSLPRTTGSVLLRDDGEPLGEPEAGAPAQMPLPAGPSHLAYVMYTSGSTGLPKGVEVTHRGVVRLVVGADYARFTPDEVFLLLTPISFDPVIFEVCGALLNGARLAVFPARVPSLDLLAQAIVRHRVTTLWLTAGLFHPMVDSRPEALRGISQLLAGGDVLSVSHVRRALAALPGCTLIDGYGPTENATFTTCHAMRDPADVGETVPIGRPIANTTVHLLDRELRPVAAGAPGELYTGGDGLARGYRNRPELTAERFVPSPFPASPEGGERLYGTGDLARWRPDGTIEFLGRRDQQVKVRGFRVELGEIEAALLRHTKVADAALVVREEPGGKVLAAYVVPRRGEALPEDLREHLRASLPEFMVPAHLVALPELPLNANGKVDRRALAARLLPSGGLPAEYEAPRTPAEARLAAIWSEVLGIERVGRHEDFFALGGHSLLAIRVLARISDAFGTDLPLSDLFAAPTVAALAQRLEAPPLAVPAVQPGELCAGDVAPLSLAQRRLWLLDLLEPGSAKYNVPVAVRLEGVLETGALAWALAEIVRRHEPLRTVYVRPEAEPVQVALPPPGPPGPKGETGLDLARLNLRELPSPARERALRQALRDEAARPFDLARGPVARFLLVEIEAHGHVLLATFHHIATDGWSMSVFFRELAVFYGDFAAGRGPSLPQPSLRYADWAVWQRQALAAGALDPQIDYWRRQLAALPVLELPADRPRSAVTGDRGASRPVSFPAELPGRLLGFGQGVTPSTVLLAGFASLLSRLSGQDDFAVGLTAAGRNRLHVEKLIGFFVNLLVARIQAADDPTFGGLVMRLRDAVLTAQAHQDIPFERLVEELQPDRAAGLSPLFQVAFTYLASPLAPLPLPGLAATLVDIDASTAKFDLTLSVYEESGRLQGWLEYRTGLFDPATIERWMGHLATLLAAATADPLRPLSELPLLAAAQRQQILREWNDTGRAWGDDPVLHQLFERQADLRPEAPAGICLGETISYGELERRANRLARLLRELGAGAGTPVGIWMERSLDMIVAVLGVVKAGGHYLPLDVAWPAERAEAILAASRTPVLVTRSAQLAQVLEVQWRTPLAHVLCLDVHDPEPPAEPVDAEAVRSLWDFVAERAVDRVSAGGFVSSYTGLPFAESEVDEYRDRVLALAAPWLRPDARILEIGCGAGLILWEMASRVACAVGLDPSGLTQERNHAQAAARGLANVDLRTGFAHEVEDLPEGTFDLIVMASTVQFFPGPLYLERVVEKALRRLAPGGALLIADVPDARRQAELPAVARRGRGACRGGTGADALVRRGSLPRSGGRAAGRGRRRGPPSPRGLRQRAALPLRRAADPGGGDRAVSAACVARVARRKQLWTGWHVKRCSAERPAVAVSPDYFAYVIHTSGSTGVPKGIGVQHRPAAGLIGWVNATFGVGPGDRLLFVASLGFDLSVYDVFGTLAAGGTIDVVPEAALRDPVRLAAMLRDEPMTIWDSAPAALQQLAPLFPAPEAAAGAARPLRLVLLSGDWIPLRLPDQVRAAFPGARVIGLGGATEATVWSNWYPIGEVDPRWPSIPYGRPIANARYLVLDGSMAPCPLGVAGDLYIGGDVLSAGYVYQPELTAAQFIPDPFAPAGARMYRTGDRARYGADGNLEFLGRVDHQVKVRGYRIELGEIEAVLSRHPGVREVVVLARQDAGGEKRLVGYIVPSRRPAPTAAGLRSFLLEALPEYMVPWSFVELEAFPVTANGKLDRAALPAPQAAVAGAHVAPRNELERAIAGVWREVLQVDRVGVHDNFFESGGSSLLIVKLHAHLEQDLGRDVPVMELFRHTTIDALARKLAGEQEASPAEASIGQTRERARSRQDSLRQLRAARADRRGRVE